MKKIKIFVEGVADVKLIRDCIFFMYNISIDESLFVRTGGYGGLFNEQNLIQLRLTNDDNGTNLVIFDADDNFRKREKELRDKAAQYSVSMKLFLLPNNAQRGDRETLLQRIANPEKYNPFAKCYDSYFTCLQRYNKLYQNTHGISLKIPSKKLERKLSIINYLKFHDQRSDEDKRNYIDQNLWDLTHDYLSPLKNFLRPYFT